MLGVAESPLNRRGSRGLILAYLMDPENVEIPKEIREKLARKELRLSDMTVYSVKEANGKTIKMFQTQDTKEVGLRNISASKMQKDQIMVVSAIRLTAALTVKEGTTNADSETLAKTAKFYPIDHKFPVPGVFTNVGGKVAFVPDGDVLAAGTITGGGYSNAAVLQDEDAVFAALENGEFSFKSNRKEIIADFPLSVFKCAVNPEKPGYYLLDNPRIIGNDTETEFTVELGEEVNADGVNFAVWLKVELIGTGTLPA